jgi:hypothetical protein
VKTVFGTKVVPPLLELAALLLELVELLEEEELALLEEEELELVDDDELALLDDDVLAELLDDEALAELLADPPVDPEDEVPDPPLPDDVTEPPVFGVPLLEDEPVAPPAPLLDEVLVPPTVAEPPLPPQAHPTPTRTPRRPPRTAHEERMPRIKGRRRLRRKRNHRAAVERARTTARARPCGDSVGRVSAPNRPIPLRHGANRVQLRVASRVRILLRDARPELHVRTERATKLHVLRQPGFVRRLHVERDEPFSLLVRDREVPMHVDEMRKTNLSRESVRTAEGLRREPREVLDVKRLPFVEQHLQHRIGEDLLVEELLEPMKRVVPACVLVKTLHLVS